VDSQEGRRHGEREDVRDEVFDWMGILGGQGDRGDKAMVKFMDVRVKVWDVQESVRVVEQDLPDESAEDQIPHNFLRTWQADITILGRLA